MHIQTAIYSVFEQLKEALEQVTPEEYHARCKALSNATIGQHTRHIIELFMELHKGYETGTVNYENRKRDIAIETDKILAIALLADISKNIEKADKALVLHSNYSIESEYAITVHTNYYRELIYNLEHTVHHMALIRVAINTLTNLTLPEGFGVATSTIKYRKQCAQ
ncbi:DinB family protein [Limnovirga soli]|uniref:DinB family protein n=1 Tax=Limnovirga soli TaxID=2656915 RepID=A0A8J8FHN6_9BACT|nr:DinB family protein [Limnovirga soli]NNV57582.1 DinB family protein [Limnovirga soli]